MISLPAGSPIWAMRTSLSECEICRGTVRDHVSSSRFERTLRGDAAGSLFAPADAVHTPLTSVRRNAGIVLVLVTVSACARGIHPASPPQTPPPQVPPPQTAPPEAPPQGATGQTPTRPAGPFVFTATAYCTGSVTASGIPVSKGMVAADPAVLPLGTRIRITRAAPYNGTYWVLDTGGAIRKRRLDLYIPDCAAARQFGRRSVHVTVISSRR